MTTNNKFFETKEQYLAFRAAFAAAQNNPRAKKGEPDACGYRKRGWLSPAHYMLLNLTRGLPYDRGFSPITADRKLNNGVSNPHESRDAARKQLEKFIAYAQLYLNPKDVESSWRYAKMTQVERNAERQKELLNCIRSFLEPVEDAFTINDLTNLKFSEATPS